MCLCPFSTASKGDGQRKFLQFPQRSRSKRIEHPNLNSAVSSNAHKADTHTRGAQLRLILPYENPYLKRLSETLRNLKIPVSIKPTLGLVLMYVVLSRTSLSGASLLRLQIQKNRFISARLPPAPFPRELLFYFAMWIHFLNSSQIRFQEKLHDVAQPTRTH